MSLLLFSTSTALPPALVSWHGRQPVSFANLAPWDRWLRVIVGVALLSAGWLGDGGSLTTVALRIFGCLPVITGLSGWSPLYSLLGISTRPPTQEG